MSKFARIFLTWCIFVGLSACGGGGGSSSADQAAGDVGNGVVSSGVSDDIQYHPSVTDDFVAVNVSGSAVKGIISNGLVTLFSLSAQGDQAGVLGSGVTDQWGSFQIDIPESYSGLVEVVVSGNSDAVSPTLMICDSSSGCGVYDSVTELDLNDNDTIDFGERFALSSAFEITHIVEYAGGGEPFSAYVTPLTHLTSRFAKSFEDGATEENLNLARNQVANLFNLVNEFDELEALDITQLEDLDSIDGDVLNYSLIAASFAGLASDGGDLGEIIAQLAADFTANNGQLLQVSSVDSDVSLSQIFQNAIDLTNQLGVASDVLDPLRNLLVQQVSYASLAQEGELTSSLFSETINADPLVQVKTFTQDLQSWSDSLQLGNLESLAFSDQLREVESVVTSTQMLAALAAVGKYAAVFSVIPDVANNEEVLPFLCGYLDGIIGTLCSSLAEQYTLAELCDDDFSILGLNACGLVMPFVNVSVPTLEPDLSLSFNLLNRELVATGMVFDQNVDMIYTVPDIYDEDIIYAHVSGSVVNDEASIEFEGVLSIDKQDDLKLSDFAEDLGASGVTGQLSIVAANDSGVMRTLSISLGENPSFAVGFESMSGEGEQAWVTLLGEVDGLSLVQSSFVVEHDDRMFELLTHEEALLVLRNQDGVEMEFYLDLEGDGQVGAIFQNSELFGTIWREGILVYVEYTDGDEADLSDLF
ncbi:MAG: hypothetical protein COB51_07280 [Moraxellaceae bacterium]|nr:MAG: hypothetical protein COB51_07280 [Moraxellaceae bacterium]